MKKVVVIGAKGQLGRDLCPRLPGRVIPLDRTRADLGNAPLLRETLTSLKPDVVVNCAAYNFVDKAEAEPEAAYAVNSFGVRDLAQICQQLDCVFAQVSTDYVFGRDTTRSTPFAETDEPGPVSVYGQSKLAGEVFARSLCRKHFVIRTCGLYGVWGSGGKGGNFVETMLRLGSQGKPLKVVYDQRCTPTSTADLAHAIVGLLETDAYGLYHLTSAGECSWYELANEIFRQSGVSANVWPITSADFGATAARPGYSVLSMAKYESLGLPAPRPWREALAGYLQERQRKAAA